MEKELEYRIKDYTNFAKVLLMVSVFFLCGVVFTGTEKTELQLIIIIVTTCTFLAGSFLFFNKVKKLQELLEEEID